MTNDCMPLVARPQISHPMTDVAEHSAGPTRQKEEFFDFPYVSKINTIDGAGLSREIILYMENTYLDR